MTSNEIDEEEVKAYGNLVLKKMGEFETFGSMRELVDNVGVTFNDKNGKQWTIRVYEGNPDDDQ